MKHIFLNGRRFAYELQGTGKVSVLLETGFGAEASEWQVVADEIAHRAPVFLYDRLGRGASDPPPGSRTSLEIHHELCALLEATGVRPPFVLVGHSFGGLLMRLFAAGRQSDVDGLVLVESMHSRQFEELGPKFPRPSAGEAGELTRMRQFWQHGWKNTESTPELIDLPLSLLSDSKRIDLGEVPLHIITAAAFRNAPFLPDNTKERLQTIWDCLQADLPVVSKKVTRTHLSKSDHFVQRDAPGSIIEAIEPLLP